MKKKSIADRTPHWHSAWLKRLLIMKMIVVLLLVAGLTASYAESGAQTTKLNLKFNSSTVKDVIEEIERQTDLSFMYDNNEFKVDRQISIDVKNETLKSVIESLISGMDLKYEIVNRYIVIKSSNSNHGTQQQKSVTGKVTDSTGGGLPGVSVVVKGTTTGTITDFDGNYSLGNVPANATLLFSFVGMRTQEIAVGTKTLINVTLEDETIGLDEVVAVGYGVQKKRDLTGSISQVKATDLENRSITSVDGGIQGKTAGVQVVTTSGAPGANTSVRIRGYSSNSDSSPLYIVDGLRTTNISFLDPSDIESMEVLKDAASAAIYGAQAGNGVILITTKKASQGSLRIEYDMQYSIQQVARNPEVLNAKEYIQYAVTEGKLVSQARIDQYYDGKTDTDWADVAFENGAMQRHSLSFQGGNATSSTYGSLSYLSNDGPIIGKQDHNNRLTGTVNTEYKIKPWLKFSSNNNFATFNTTRVREGGMYSMLGSVIQMDPLTPVIYSKDNVPAHIQALVNQNHAFLKDENGDYYSMSPFQESNNINPYIMRDAFQQQSEGFNFRGSSNIDVTPWETVVFTSRLGYDYSSLTSYDLTWPHTANTDTNTDYVTITAGSNDNKYWQWENFVNYNESFNKHNVNAMAGTSYSERVTFGVTGTVAGSSATNIGITKLDRNYAYFANASGTSTKTLTGGEKRLYAEMAYFGRLSYNYDNKYFLQGSYRADAADLSILPLKKRWGYFPSFSTGWTISRESFFKNLNLNAISNLKLRGSWGQNGSISGLGNYMYASNIISDVMYPFTASTYQVGSRPSATGNNNLQWETSEQLDFGLDLRMLKDRLSLSVDWYKKETKDLIMTTVNSSAVVGNTISPLNAGNVVNKGFEFDLSWRDKIGNDFTYGISGNLATLKNEVTYMYPTLSRVAGSSGGSGVTSYFEKGYPIWYMRGYKYLGVNPANGSPIFNDSNKDGLITDIDKTNIGSAIPDMTYGITLNMAYKGFDFIVFANGTIGNEICYAVPRSTRLQANTLKYFYDRRWTTPGQNAEYIASSLPDFSNYVQSSAYVFDGSYFKIKQIQLGYTVPKQILNRAKILDKARLYVSLDDFFVFTKYPGFDPEVSMSGNGLGLDYGQYPTTRRVTFGINLSF